ncbi:MAG: single-stranded DNA-binding protein [Akkermansia sp.]
MRSFCRVTIAGVITVAPSERFYSVTDSSKRLMELTVLVEQPVGEEGAASRRSPFRVAVFDEALMALCGTLAVNQRVVVVADLSNEQWQGKDGKIRDSFRLSARNIVPGQAFGATASRPLARGFGEPRRSGCDKPLMRPVPAPTPASHDADEDIPF